jgi:hypothetical protein
MSWLAEFTFRRTTRRIQHWQSVGEIAREFTGAERDELEQIEADGNRKRLVEFWPEDRRERFEERAAVMEFDGGLSRDEAERRAFDEFAGARDRAAMMAAEKLEGRIIGRVGLSELD